jgi:hypothetical protein
MAEFGLNESQSYLKRYNSNENNVNGESAILRYSRIRFLEINHPANKQVVRIVDALSTPLTGANAPTRQVLAPKVDPRQG